MGAEMSDFIAQVQAELNELGGAPTISVNEQSVVEDFKEQDFSARSCAERIVAGRVQ